MGALIGLFIRLVVLGFIALIWLVRIALTVVAYVAKVTIQLLAQNGAKKSPDGRYWWNGRAWRPMLGPAYWAVPASAIFVLVVSAAFGISAATTAAPSTDQASALSSPTQERDVATTVSPVTQLAVTPVPSSSPQPSPNPTPRPSPAASPTNVPQPPPQNLCGAPPNPWGYNFCGGSLIYAPPGNFCSYFNCIASFWKSTNGYVDECQDGTYSHSGGRPGACSYHGGELRPLHA